MVVSLEDAWRTRIVDGEGEPVGAGVLVAGGRILTCAHVVQGVLGLREGESPAGREVVVDFPGSLAAASRGASVVPRAWAPQAGERADVAVLHLHGSAPEDCVPAGLRACGPARDRSVRAFGQASGHAAGRWVRGRLLGAGGLSPDWVQMEAAGSPGEFMLPGFSGAGAVDETGSVIGIVVAVDGRPGHPAAWMIPVEAAVRYCPSLADALTGDSAPGPWPPGADREITTALARVPSVYDPVRRESVLRDTGEDIAFLTQRSPVLLEDVRNIVATCLQYADGIDRLAAAVRWYERGSLPEREFEQVLERLRTGARAQEHPR